ncbi:hypothetical protein GCM10025882_32180 [Acinetobacter gyllenbergii]|uniref:Uncharacterized protein n=1 Tax=Acinetobacter gyllenbergii CIP 110306 = MTCC 11365 TaxID=1217657 RepID=A0A829HCJ1_9GAMM|nr:hypothetical protein [Acinetobacter gyllenbergii]EPF72591.1 hypothetical protein F957_03727 [Acinetobacter gyllenbergii CIP 110306 = MTCC 11365]EPH31112.1 hypothetical protein L293_2515 [Acinetobacter gyllenbergii CIP 110306 = MTCC 11365]GMA12793.1 hypothetical protein GCM10025882_32180 [Acinetobacter gyllenbergii]
MILVRLKQIFKKSVSLLGWKRRKHANNLTKELRDFFEEQFRKFDPNSDKLKGIDVSQLKEFLEKYPNIYNQYPNQIQKLLSDYKNLIKEHIRLVEEEKRMGIFDFPNPVDEDVSDTDLYKNREAIKEKVKAILVILEKINGA